jgi:hypothetical protein
MKKAIIFCMVSILAARAPAQSNNVSIPDSTQKIQVVETACGQCMFHLPGKGCSLAVRIDGKAYFVKGTDIDSHGDAHAADGFCNSVRKAEVQGKLVKNSFHVTYFKLIAGPLNKP